MTHAELRTELEQLESRLEEKLEEKLEQKLEEKLEEKLEQKLEEKLEAFEKKLEAKFDHKLEAYATKLDLELWVGALRHEIHSRLDMTDRRIESLERKIDNFPQAFAAELARHVNASREEATGHIRAVDEKYSDLPGRVSELERRIKPDTR